MLYRSIYYRYIFRCKKIVFLYFFKAQNGQVYRPATQELDKLLHPKEVRTYNSFLLT